MSNLNFALSINNKDQLKDLNNCFNQKVITAINNFGGSTLGDNLIASQQVLIPVEAVENDQESMALRASYSNKVGSIVPFNVSGLYNLGPNTIRKPRDKLHGFR